MCFYRWFVQPTHLCVAHSELHNVQCFHVVHVVWCGVVWCGVVGWGGVLVSGAMVVDEVSEGGEVIGIEGSHSLGEKAVEQSGGAGSDAPVPSSRWQELGRDGGRDGCGPS